MNDQSYTVEKLTNVLHCLATHPGDVRQRLACACAGFHALKAEDFPLELQADCYWINKELTKFGPKRNDLGEVCLGSVDHTMKRIRKATGEKIAKKLYSLYWAVSENQPYL